MTKVCVVVCSYAPQMIKNKKKCAFTMAEALITLLIIGIVAALTIPNLARKWEERAIVSKSQNTGIYQIKRH